MAAAEGDLLAGHIDYYPASSASVSALPWALTTRATASNPPRFFVLCSLKESDNLAHARPLPKNPSPHCPDPPPTTFPGDVPVQEMRGLPVGRKCGSQKKAARVTAIRSARATAKARSRSVAFMAEVM